VFFRNVTKLGSTHRQEWEEYDAAGGYTAERILTAYPDLARDDVSAALEYAARGVDEEQVILR
jgi:hypothetical protein